MAKASEVVHNITQAFNRIGKNADTTFTDLNAREAPAHEFIVAKTLARLALKRLEQAEEAARKVGVLGQREDYIKGQEITVWRPRKSPPPLIITARTSNDRIPMLDRSLLTAALLRHFSKEQASAIVADASKPCEPSVTYGIVLFS